MSKIFDWHSNNILDQEFHSQLVKCPDLIIKLSSWYIHDFLKAVGNKAGTFFPFNAAATACFSFFNSNMFSLITPLVFNKVMLPLFQFPRCITAFWSLFFSLRKLKGDSKIKIFVRNQLPIKTSRIQGSVMGFIKCLLQELDGSFFFWVMLY